MRLLMIVSASILLQAALLAQTERQLPAGPQRIMMWRRENPLVEVLESIRRVGRFRLQVDADAKPLLDRRITVKFADATVEEALAIVLRAGKLTYRVLDDQTVQILKPQQ